MRCPNCGDRALRPVLASRGVVVDHCESCRGVWLDRGELFHFARHPRLVADKLEAALAHPTPTAKPSPAAGTPMVEIIYPGGPRMDHCPKSGGLWFDGGELEAFLEAEPEVRLDLEPTAPAAVLDGVVAAPPQAGAKQSAAAAALVPLPNLFLRSTLTLFGLYAILVAVLIAAVEFVGLDLELALGIGVAAVVLQFLVGPFVMDLTLRWLYSLRWVTSAQLPAHLTAFVSRLCAEQGIKPPRFGVIDDGAPQAFTYGHTPNNARVVISRGLLELLDPEEAEAVVAHEIGHAVHWDMVLMTVAQLVPLLLYYLYRSLIRAQTSSRRSKGGGAVVAVAIGAYVLYIISQYVVLWFSRTREYHADRFAGRVTGDPARLARALVKIAYGLAGQDKTSESSEEARARNPNLQAIGALGIFDSGAARALAVASYAAPGGGAESREGLEGAMRWDLWNPWAKWYELNSTHPLVAKRLRHLSDQAVHMGQPPYVVFDETQPESYWDEFFTDLAVHLLPVTALLLTLAAGGVTYVVRGSLAGDVTVPLLLTLLGGAMLLRFGFAYQADFFPSMSVLALLKRVKVSAVRPVPCTVRGTVIGRGVPGYIASEDFVMRDETGIMFLDYRQPLAIWEFLFGLLKAGEYQGREVVVEGWYRRAPVPYVEVRSITCDGKRRKSWVPLLNQLSAAAIALVGVLWLVLALFAPGLLPI